MLTRVVFDARFDAWRVAARRLLHAGVPPDRAIWSEAGDTQKSFGELFETALPDDGTAPTTPDAQHRVPPRFLSVAAAASCFRDPARWSLLYRLLWRLTHGEPHLMEVDVDQDVHRLLAMEKAVRRDTHKMHAFVRFRTVERDGETHFVAWFAPEHLIVEHATPFFARRFANMRWSILTPDASAAWDLHALRFGPGIPRSDAPAPDALEDLWRTYYASTFNPARLKTNAMRAEMPKKYWSNLPEASLIPKLVQEAPARVEAMIERARRELARPSEGRLPRRRGGPSAPRDP